MWLDLMLHGFGLKSTARSSWIARELLHTADSMAWGLSAPKQGRSDWREAKRWTERINSRQEPAQKRLFSACDLLESA
ncbi:hypothetical protein BZM27_23285 [Paraburkholderia steynii]|uniref:Uncharacterized protein n=1 Tax=Paraburkholderia steynii TaxID=1245441 RepID=A0A4R0X9E2_9BURK|nr:hypothetical protein BZM27_23285 [Paraburkholderia steynii]